MNDLWESLKEKSPPPPSVPVVMTVHQKPKIVDLIYNDVDGAQKRFRGICEELLVEDGIVDAGRMFTEASNRHPSIVEDPLFEKIFIAVAQHVISSSGDIPVIPRSPLVFTQL